MSESPSSLQRELEAIACRYKIDDVYVFGSRAEVISKQMVGQPQPSRITGSDVDIGVKPAVGHRLNAQDRVHLMLELEDLLDVERIDMVILPEADPFLAVNVIRGELLYCANRYAQAEYELYLLRRADDLAPYAHARTQSILA